MNKKTIADIKLGDEIIVITHLKEQTAIILYWDKSPKGQNTSPKNKKYRVGICSSDRRCWNIYTDNLKNDIFCTAGTGAIIRDASGLTLYELNEKD